MERKTKTSSKVKNRYNEKAYDRIGVIVPKGKKAIIEEHASKYDKSVNAFINRAIGETMKRDNEPLIYLAGEKKDGE